MDIKYTLEHNCDTVNDLEAYLRNKGKNHNYYKCYSSLNRIIAIRDSKNLYLSNGERWNDIIDRNSFNSSTNPFENFGKCFSFSQEESVAMWMLYGGIDKLSGMIDFTKKAMQAILDVPTVQVGYFDSENMFKPIVELKSKDFEIYITDIIYYKKNGAVYHINRSDESYCKLSEDVFKNLNVCKKSYPWKYENECRLIVSINKKLINKDCKVVQINLESIDMGKSFKRVYHGPNYPSNDIQNSLPSKLENTIDWSLCDGQNCINGNRGENNGNI